MTEFWLRYVEFAGITSEQLDIHFRVECNTSNDEPNRARVTVYNLSEASKEKFRVGDVAELVAGYKQDHGTIFMGKITEVYSEVQGADVATHVELVDATDDLLAKKITKSWAPGTPAVDVIKDVLAEVGVAVELEEQSDVVFESGYAVQEKVAKDVVHDVLSELVDFEVYFRHGTAVVAKKQTGVVEGYSLSPETGLLSVQKAKTAEEGEESEYDYIVKALLLWKIAAGSVIQIESKAASGTFKVVEYEHVCDALSFTTTMKVKGL